MIMKWRSVSLQNIVERYAITNENIQIGKNKFWILLCQKDS